MLHWKNKRSDNGIQMWYQGILITLICYISVTSNAGKKWNQIFCCKTYLKLYMNCLYYLPTYSLKGDETQYLLMLCLGMALEHAMQMQKSGRGEKACKSNMG